MLFRSSGRVYPYPTTEKISQEKTDKVYKAVYLENEYLKLMILPELGGRIQRAYDKTNDYDFVYYNHVIKPALVGLAGPWISGGIEFNWPQHHRPTTYMPVDYKLVAHKDGSRTLLINDTDQMYGTKGIAGFTLYPGKAYIEIRGQLYNRTSIPQTFLWWANPAVAVNEHTQSIFPPDVHCVMDHGKRDVSRFPIAKGVYYKHDYSEGVDISRYKNIPVPTSYMAEKSDYDFVGGYDYGKEAGLLHVADHHVSPGKKQWTWGCGDFGKAWDRNLTDEDGPYIELMTGVYTENQPDFTWLKPFEEKTFKQYFMPYKKVGAVKNATVDAALNVEISEDRVKVTVYATSKHENATVLLLLRGEEVWREQTVLSPVEIYEREILKHIEKPEELKTAVYDGAKLLVAYQPKKESIPKLAQPAEAAKEPEDIKTNEELLLTGQHIEQHRHATYLPDPYYLEGLKRDPGDSRLNNAYGMLLYKRGKFAKAEVHFRKAVERLTLRSPNPYNSESYYNLGLSLYATGKMEEAYDAFYKATWSSEQQEMGYYYTAAIQAMWKNEEESLALVEKSLVKNMHNVKARALKAVLLRRLGRPEEEKSWILENLAVDPFDYVSLFEQAKGSLAQEKEARLENMNRLMRDFWGNYLQAAEDYGEWGCYEEAIAMLKQCGKKHPMLYYYRGFYAGKLGDDKTRQQEYARAEQASPLYCFPNQLCDIAVLLDAIHQNPEGAKAYYYLGCLFYDKLQQKAAIRLFEKSIELDESDPTAHRNLALGYYNILGEKEKAKQELERAFLLDETDARVFFELDCLRKKLNTEVTERLRAYEAHEALVRERDDAMLEWVTLYNLAGMPKKAYEVMMSHVFRPWEGAEGRIATQYKIALTALAGEALHKKDYKKAKELLERALVYPVSLGEGKLEGTKDNDIYYQLGAVNKLLGDKEQFLDAMERAECGDNEPAGAMYYYDQPADMILYQGLAREALGDHKGACACFNKLMDYGERHLPDEVKNDFFAVSLPDFMIFYEDMTAKNKAHCYYLMGLAKLGFQEYEGAGEAFLKALSYDYNHQNCRRYKLLCEEKRNIK